MNHFNHIPLILDGKDFIAEIATTANGTMVAIRGICDAMGIASFNQREKVKGDPRFSWHDIMSTGTDGKSYSMFCLPVEQIVPWLFTINSNKLKKPEVRENLLRFQTYLGKELNAVAFGQISSENTVALQMQIRAMAEQIKTLSENQAALQKTIATVVADNLSLREENRVVRETNSRLWKAREFQGKAASYGMHSAKSYKKATETA